MPSPTVSVIIPTYGHKDYVLQTLDSVFAQTFADYEVIVVNDGSPDDTAELLKPLREVGRIKYIEQPNAGQASARNRGFAEVRGEFIAFLDDDDRWPQDKLAWQVKALKADTGLGVVAGRAVFFERSPEHYEELRPRDRAVTFESLFLGNPISSPGQTLIRASLLKKHGGFSNDIWGVDDLDLWMRLSRVSRIEIHPQLALLYRRHEGNASDDYLRMLTNHVKVLQKNLPFVERARRRTLKREAYLRLYEYLGSRVVGVAKLQAKRGNLRTACRQLLRLGVFFPHLPLDMRLLRSVGQDLLPWRNACHGKSC